MNITQMRLAKPASSVSAVLNYIEDLANEVGVNVREWNIKEVFQGNGTGDITHSKNDINRRFFARIKDVETPKFDLPDNVRPIIEKLEKEFKVARRNVIEREIGVVNAQLQELDNRIREKISLLKTKYESFENVKLTTTEHVGKILMGGFYKFSGAAGNSTDPVLEFTTIPVTLIYQRTDREIRLPMGEYIISWCIKTNVVQVGPFKNNLRFNAYCSPFVSNTNTVCWGQSANQVHKWQAEGNVAEVFNTLQVLLTQYHAESNPYRSIEDFEAMGEINGVPWKEYIKTEQKEEVKNVEAQKEEPIQTPSGVGEERLNPLNLSAEYLVRLGGYRSSLTGQWIEDPHANPREQAERGSDESR